MPLSTQDPRRLPIGTLPTPPHTRCRGFLLAVGGLATLAATLVMGTPTAIAAPSTEATDAINEHYTEFGGANSLLGATVGDPVEVAGGAERGYQGGVIYYSKDTGAKVMYGAILDKYKSIGGPTSDLGFPKNDEADTGDGVGRFNDFAEAGGAAIYWNPQSGAWVIKGRVLDAWRESGAVKGPFGYPNADMTVANGVSTSTFGGPAGTEIQWSDSTGLVTVPAALAATLPGFNATAPNTGGTISVPTPSVTEPAPAPATNTSSDNGKWWGVPIGLAIAAVAGGLFRLIGRRRGTEVRGPRQPTPATPTPAAPTPAPRASVPKFTAPVAPKVSTPKFDAPVADIRQAPRVVAPTERVAPPAPKAPVIKDPLPATPPPATPRDGKGLTGAVPDPQARHSLGAEQGEELDITYENNALGTNQRSSDDKSDVIHQHGNKSDR